MTLALAALLVGSTWSLSGFAADPVEPSHQAATAFAFEQFEARTLPQALQPRAPGVVPTPTTSGRPSAGGRLTTRGPRTKAPG